MLMLFVGCATRVEPRSKTLVFDYHREFAPSALTWEIVGDPWYRWNNHGDSDPTKFDDIRVVVYRNSSLEEVKQTYPVDEKKKMDYRYLDYDTAINFLSKHEDKPYCEALRDTKKKIIEKLGS